MHSLASIAEHLSAASLSERIRDVCLMLMSTIPAELDSVAAAGDSSAIARCRAVLAAILGEPHERSFDVKFWDGTVDRGGHGRAYTLVFNRPASLRRMLLPPNELSLVEAFISGDVDIEGSMEAAGGAFVCRAWAGTDPANE